jgi:uncharacterized protein
MFTDTLTSMVAGITPQRSKAQSVTFAGRTMTDREIDNAVRFSSLAQRIVTMPAEDATRRWREWQADADIITKIEDVESKFGIQGKIRATLERARKHGDAYIYMDNGEDPSTPLVTKTARPLRFVNALRPYVMIPGEIEDDPMSEFYDRPAYYEFAAGAAYVKVHPSRVVHFIGVARDDAVNTYQNDSVLTALMDDLKNHDSAMACLADMMFEAKIDIMKVKDLMQRVSDPETEKAMTARYQLAALMKSVNGMMVMDMEDEDYQQKQLSFATLPDVIDRFQIAASGAARIPRAMLFGVSAGGLGSTGDLEISNYDARIKSLQENELTPAMWRMDDMIVKTALNTVPPEVHYNWRELRSMSDKDKAEIGVNITKKYVDAVNAGIFSAEFATAPLVNELTEAGISPGLEQAFNEWTGDMQSRDDVELVE